jgi:hypothetical protein
MSHLQRITDELTPLVIEDVTEDIKARVGEEKGLFWRLLRKKIEAFILAQVPSLLELAIKILSKNYVITKRD